MDMTMFRRRGLLLNTPHIVNESGSIVTFDSAYNKVPIKRLICNIEPIQEGSGDPSPENVRPISGRTGLNVVRSGKNLLHITEIVPNPNLKGISCTINDDGGVHVEGTYPASTNNVLTLGHITLMPGTYTLNGNSVDNSSAGYRLQLLKGTSFNLIGYDYGNGLTFTVTEKTDYVVRIHITGNLAYNNPINTDMYPMISLDGGEYEPYKGSTYSVNWETKAGTVYGGHVDAVSGKLTIDHVFRTLNGSESWQVVSGTYNYYRLRVGDFDSVINASIICDIFKQVGIANATNNQGINVYNSSTVNGAFISIRYDSLFTSLNELKDYLADNNVSVVYKRTMPTEIHLTAQEITTLLGENNIWCDSGDISIDYWKWGN